MTPKDITALRPPSFSPPKKRTDYMFHYSDRYRSGSFDIRECITMETRLGWRLCSYDSEMRSHCAWIGRNFADSKPEFNKLEDTQCQKAYRIISCQGSGPDQFNYLQASHHRGVGWKAHSCCDLCKGRFEDWRPSCAGWQLCQEGLGGLSHLMAEPSENQEAEGSRLKQLERRTI